MDILSLTAVELAKAIREGKTTSVEATQAVLDKIAASEDTYHCYVTVEREKALQQAAEVQKKIEAGELTGPLAGVPFAIKDNMCTEGTGFRYRRFHSTARILLRSRRHETYLRNGIPLRTDCLWFLSGPDRTADEGRDGLCHRTGGHHLP